MPVMGIRKTHPQAVPASGANSFALALTLFVLRIFADNPDTAFALDDLAFLANWFH